MNITQCLLLCVATHGMFVEGKPQGFSFPDDSDDISERIPTSTPDPTTSTAPPPTTPAVAQNGTTTTIRSTRIPARDPGNRIVYLVSCPCNFTYQYSPICGTDGQTYGNAGVLQCARQCGKKVDVYLAGACGSNNG